MPKEGSTASARPYRPRSSASGLRMKSCSSAPCTVVSTGNTTIRTMRRSGTLTRTITSFRSFSCFSFSLSLFSFDFLSFLPEEDVVEVGTRSEDEDGLAGGENGPGRGFFLSFLLGFFSLLLLFTLVDEDDPLAPSSSVVAMERESRAGGEGSIDFEDEEVSSSPSPLASTSVAFPFVSFSILEVPKPQFR